jgi:hypothetical protein
LDNPSSSAAGPGDVESSSAGSVQPPVPAEPPRSWNATAPVATYPAAYGWPEPYARRPRPPIDPAKVYRPGVWFYLVAGLVVLVGLYSASLPGESGGAGFVWLAGMVLAFVWFVGFIIAANDTRLQIPGRTWARWAGIPALGVLFVGLASTNVPVALRFDLSRSQLDQAAASARSGNAPGPGWIGLVPVDAVQAYPDGVVVVEVSAAGGCGFANFSGPWPTSLDPWSPTFNDGEGQPIDHLSGDWYTWCRYDAFD